jgi:hypothetical protein
MKNEDVVSVNAPHSLDDTTYAILAGDGYVSNVVIELNVQPSGELEMSVEIDLAKQLVQQIGFARSSLANRCTALAENMRLLARKLDGDMPNDSLCINDLGEIQSQGTIIDAECGRLATRIDMLQLLKQNLEGVTE